jgi:hypothetical protein
MAAGVESEPRKKEGLEVRPEEMEIPPEVERATGATPTQTQVTAQVTDDTGKPLISPTVPKAVTVQVPASPSQLDEWSKGSPTASLTWFATFWLRIIKKAFHFGWRVITKGGQPK